jgi:hypothetical protein
MEARGAAPAQPGSGRGLPKGRCEASEPADLLECAFHNVQCSADKAIAPAMRRAYDLLSELDADVDEVLPCVTDPRLGLE